AALPVALRDAHFPENENALATAHRRLAFDDFLFLQLGLAILRSRTTRARGVALNPPGDLVSRLRAALPYRLTSAQERVWSEIRRDMAAPFPMHRLLQGDVGSGKTVVAALAVLTAIEAGYQAAVMAPTEILAEQHFMTFRQLLEPLGVTVALLTSASACWTRCPLDASPSRPSPAPSPSEPRSTSSSASRSPRGARPTWCIRSWRSRK